jgi:hypothetical protein
MKRVSFANKPEVRFFEKDAHRSPAEKAAPPPNRVMPAEGTDAHHSLLHDPVKLSVDAEPPTPNRMDLSVARPSVAVDENTDPRFSLDDPPSSHDDEFEKSAYMSLGDNSADNSDHLSIDDLEKSAYVYGGDLSNNESSLEDGVPNPAETTLTEGMSLSLRSFQ